MTSYSYCNFQSKNSFIWSACSNLKEESVSLSLLNRRFETCCLWRTEITCWDKLCRFFTLLLKGWELIFKISYIHLVSLHRNSCCGPSDLSYVSWTFPTLQPVTMEARGKYDFNATAADELSFRKGDILKVSECQVDKSLSQSCFIILVWHVFSFFFWSDYKPTGWLVQGGDEWSWRICTTKLHWNAVTKVRDSWTYLLISIWSGMPTNLRWSPVESSPNFDKVHTAGSIHLHDSTTVFTTHSWT